ncbi:MULTISPECIES: TraB/GumN family protein [Flavobacteriaceae]|uniref:TraB/GumN family protein n=2 Tax=Flavobacteriaceae TaxID=49546 RepID=A0A4Y8AUA1_9FLAO|nr:MULTISPECIES: TraB/GumN family protein [Flavobacteriaceae]TEW75481.1 TraB/GumN family protein [Gramella jeungdoensis]GGK45567.1 lipoprotein [Lutibacter litoralis]
MRKLLLSIIIILSILQCRPKHIEPLPQNGLFWKISGNGLKHNSYLFGTYHKEGGMKILDSIKTFDSIFNLSNQLICEVQLADYFKFSNKKKENNLNSIRNNLKPWPIKDSTYDNLLNNKQKNLLDSCINSSKLLTSFKLANINLRPIDLLYYFNFSYRESLNTSNSKNHIPTNDTLKKYYLDSYIRNLARKRNMKIVSLDSPAEYLEVIDSVDNLYSQLSYSTEVDIMLYYIKNHITINSLRQDIAESYLLSYLKQDLSFSLNTNKQEEVNIYNNKLLYYLENDNFIIESNKLLFDKRNNYWMNKIPKLLIESSCFIAVGAGHLSGEEGLINQLRELEYTVVRIP